MLNGTAERLANPTVALAPELEALEAEERQLFSQLGGKEVDTGRLKLSLTEHGPDSIREVTPLELVFGTRVPYAPYQRSSVEGHEDVMVDTAEERMSGVGQRVLDRIVR